MYKTKSRLVNGNIINDLLSICNNQFINPFIQSYASANIKCIFCGCAKQHDEDCPVIHYQNIVEKYSNYIKQI